MTEEVKYCQDCIARGTNPPNIATREWVADCFLCDECFQPLLNNMANIAPASMKNAVSKVEEGPILNQVYQLLHIPPELQFDSVDVTCRNYDKIFNFHAPANVNRNLESLTNEIEQWQIALFQIKYKIEPLQYQISKLKEEIRKEKNLAGVKDTAESYVKDGPSSKKTSKVKQSQVESLAGKLGFTPEQLEKIAKQAREKEFKKLTGVCARCGLAHDSDECPPGSVLLANGIKKPVQPTPLGRLNNGASNPIPQEPKTTNLTSKEELLAKARARLGK